jgi:predicted aspartyl protease
MSSENEALVQLRLRGDSDQETLVNAVIDTGFTGYLCVEPSVTSHLRLSRQASTDVMLADGNASRIGHR